MADVEVYIEGFKVTLSDDEGINIKLNTQDINDISKVNAGYTKDWTVPPSKKNNLLFKHYYNADIVGGFDARTKKNASILLKGLHFISGKVRLTSVSLEDNVVIGYRIQFEGDVVNIKDVLGDKKLSDLDFSAFNHTYNSSNVRQGVETSLFSGSVIYPLISPIKRFVYDSADNFVNTPTSTNIHYNGALVNNSISYNELKPAIKIAKLVEMIKDQNGLDFVGDFFNRDYYDKLFMWLSNDKGLMDVSSDVVSNLIDWNGGSSEWINFSNNVFTIEWLLSPNPFDKIFFTNTVTIPSLYSSVPYNYVVTINGAEVHRENGVTGSNIFNNFITQFQYTVGDVRFYIESSQVLGYSASLSQNRISYGSYPTVVEDKTEVTTASLSTIEGVVDLSKQVPDIKQVDVIIGIIKMFNIALTSNPDKSITWETLPDWYRAGKVYKGFEKYIVKDKKTISRGKLNNEFKFQYQKPTTVLADQFNQNNGVSYGDLEARLFDENDVLLDGGKLEVKLPFENMMFERLRDLNDNSNIGFQYGYAVDKELSPVVSKPIIFYNVNGLFEHVGFKNDSGNLENLNTTLNTPNHCLSVSDNNAQTLNFGAEISTYNYGVTTQSLYKSFYEDYVTDMFSDQRRVYVFDAEIPSFIMADIKLNDRLIIMNRRYIINSINSNLTTGKTKLELLNDIYTSGDLVGDSFYVDPSFMRVSASEDNYSATVYNSGRTKVSAIDEGFGVFATLNTSPNITGISTFKFSVDANNTGQERVVSFELENQETKEIIKVFIEQEAGSVTIDNNTITIDNNIITIDNN